MFSGRVNISGRINQMDVVIREIGNEGGYFQEYRLTVLGDEIEKFTVANSLYHWLSIGDKVLIDFWPHTKMVAGVAKSDIPIFWR